jgi:hypothetical protein
VRENCRILYSGYIPEEGSRRFLQNVGLRIRGVTLRKTVFFLSRGAGSEM